MPKELKLTIDSRLENIELVSLAVHALVSYYGFEDKTAKAIELCLVEAMNNSIKHSYDNQPGNPLEIKVFFVTDYLQIDIIDYGRGMSCPLQKRELPKLDPNSIASLPECGYGLYLMQQIMDDVKYNVVGLANIFTLIKYINLKKVPMPKQIFSDDFA
ncbi:MAG: ATP-binding protein [Parachlamydiales bacterium]|nr:ATP-binding protein [Parachlamydiales bacterium]